MKVLYLDESGNHNLNSPDPEYSIFVLGGIIVDEAQSLGDMEYKVRVLKRRLFKSDSPVLHSTDIYHARAPWFTGMSIPEKRAKFNAEFSNLLETLNCQLLACAIDKKKHLARYGTTARDPYYYALSVIVERFYLELQHLNKQGPAIQGKIVAEKRNPQLDSHLRHEWDRLNTEGTGPLNPASLQQLITGMETRPKADNIAGLQVADMVLSVIAREILNLDSTGRIDYSVVEGKYRRNAKGEYLGYGLVILPK